MSYSLNPKIQNYKTIISREPNSKICSDVVGITGSSDGCWLKRGNGFSYDSHAGFVSVMGQESGKVLAYRVKQNYCRSCAQKKKSCGKLDCCKNWSGSSKSMESGAVVEMVADNPILESLGVVFERLVCDGDSSVGAGIREATNGECIRVADVIHTIKHLSNHLYAAKSKELTSQAIDYLKRLASLAIKTNKDDPPAIVDTLSSIPYHAFGMHSKCNQEWCKQSEDEGSLWSKYLDRPIDVEGSSTFQTNFSAVRAAFDKIIEKAPELAPNGSTQPNESLNAIITSKAPKRINFASSSAVSFRCAAGVAQKNFGVEYTAELRKLNKISPGKWTTSYKSQLAKMRSSSAEKKKSPEYKKRRRQLLLGKKNQTVRTEAREGKTYEKGI